MLIGKETEFGLWLSSLYPQGHHWCPGIAQFRPQWLSLHKGRCKRSLPGSAGLKTGQSWPAPLIPGMCRVQSSGRQLCEDEAMSPSLWCHVMKLRL